MAESRVLHRKTSRSGGRWLSVDWAGPKSLLPDDPAIYVAYSRGKVVYVGQTKRLRQRLYGHPFAPRFDAVKMSVEPNKAIRLKIERLLIQRLKPELNHQWTGRYREPLNTYAIRQIQAGH